MSDLSSRVIKAVTTVQGIKEWILRGSHRGHKPILLHG